MSGADYQKENILRLVRESDCPVSAKQVSGKASGSSTKKEVQIAQDLLRDLAVSGLVFEFPPERVGLAGRFGQVSPLEWVSNRITRLLNESGGRITQRQLRQKLYKWETRYLDTALGRLANDGRLFYLTVKFKYVLSYPPTPFDHLLPRQVTELRDILERVNRHRKRALSISDLKAFLDSSENQKNMVSQELTEELLNNWYKRDVLKRGGLTSIPIPWTWSHYEAWCKNRGLKPNLDRFQDFLWDLHRAGRIEFIPHSMTQELPEREAALSLRNRHGEVLYYWKWR